MMLRALWYRDREEFERARSPGSFRLEQRKRQDLYEMIYFCPCGCGTENRLLVGDGHKPDGARPSWRWNGLRSEPTLHPSVHMVGHWHGWLRGGYWETCT
jgi:hypothetical protein